MDNDVSKRVMTQPEKVDYILTKSAEYFGVDKKDFGTSCSKGDRLWGKKKYVALILDDKTLLSREEMSKLMGFTCGNNVSYWLKTTRAELSDEFYGNDKSKMFYNELLSYLNL